MKRRFTADQRGQIEEKKKEAGKNTRAARVSLTKQLLHFIEKAFGHGIYILAARRGKFF